LAQSAALRQENDCQKFDDARKLHTILPTIIKTNQRNLHLSQPVKMRQLASAFELIRLLSLRIGNEKGSDEADTVGTCMLRVEHITLRSNRSVRLDFLGKDSVAYDRTFTCDSKLYSNLLGFVKGKANSELLFDHITPPQLNQYIQSLCTISTKLRITAKVFRTYNASQMFQLLLDDIPSRQEKETVNVLLHQFNLANIEVARICNHQTKPSSNNQHRIERLQKQLKEIETDPRHQRKIEALQRQIILYEKLQNLTLNTSRANYIDPRISVAFFKKHDLPLDKIYTPSQRKRFEWAFQVDKNWRF
jgi:DNA topoisomerase-1